MKWRLNIFCMLAIAVNPYIIKEVSSVTCQLRPGFNCLRGVPGGVTAANCMSERPQCSWCNSLPTYRKCQSQQLSCLLPTREDVPGGPFTSKTACENAGGVFCDGSQIEQCVFREPATERCFMIMNLNPCQTTATSQKTCHEAGCFWCGAVPDYAVSTRENSCFEVPNSAKCPNNEVCCQTMKCGAPGITKTECEALGCHICTDVNGKVMCNIGLDPNPAPNCIEAAHDCLRSIPRTAENCMMNAPQCQYCPDLRWARRCQTRDRSCLVTEQWELDGTLNETACVGAGGVFCNGDYKEMCIYPEPADRLCFKPGLLLFCGGADTIRDKKECHLQGCLWCGDDAFDVRQDKCWEMPNEATCSGGSQCCMEERCMDGYDPDPVACKNMGCHICTDDQGRGLCNYGPEAPICPDEYHEDCFENVPAANQTEEMCEALCCKWCTNSTTHDTVCIRTNNEFPGTCSAALQSVCKKTGLDTCPNCKSYGCEWCGTDTTHTDCQESTTCTSCECSNPVECCGKTPEACGYMGCIWCAGGSTVGNYNCINANSEGLTAATAHTFTECSRTCGNGTQWRYSDCGMANPLSCPREYQTCNSQPCSEDLCTSGELLRFNPPGTCCLSQNFGCGINPRNTFTPPSDRKKRVVGGDDIMTIENAPWLGVAYFNATTKCSVIILDNSRVLTHSSCVAGYNESEIVVQVGVYDRDVSVTTQGGEQKGVASFTTIGELTMLELDSAMTYGDRIFPICLPNGEVLQEDTKCLVTGWGLTEAGNASSCAKTPHEAVVRRMDDGLCQLAWGVQFNDSDQFCAGIAEGNKDACTGDTGSPLVCQRCENCGWYLAGVATESVGCGQAAKPSLYADVGASVYNALWAMVTGVEFTQYSSCAV